ncbi:MAG: PorT family protein [Bacteroidales bacterium]|nr:PorT family protein [Bacteroidales bacterium]MCF8405661.1 PorT family protein [Bacteroidales bacterium]
MRKVLLSLVLVSFFGLFSQAQLLGGIKGGANLTDIIVSNHTQFFEESTFNPRLSYHFGSFVQNNFSDHFSWRIEMLFSKKGYILKTEDIKTNVSLNYLNWPIMVVYNPSKKITIETGMEIGYMITGEDLYNAFDMGNVFGLRYNFSEKIHLGLRYIDGFPFKMNLNTKGTSGEVPRYQHSVLQVSLGYNLINEPPGQPNKK